MIVSSLDPIDSHSDGADDRTINDFDGDIVIDVAGLSPLDGLDDFGNANQFGKPSPQIVGIAGECQQVPSGFIDQKNFRHR